MKSKSLNLCFLLAAAALPCGLAHGQAALNGGGGVNMQGVGRVSNAPVIPLPTSLSGALSWEQGPGLQGYIVPAGQLTGLTTAGTLVSYEDLLPLKATKLQVMTGTAGAAPTGVGTIIDSLGIDTNSIITDAFQLVTGAGAGKVLVSNAGGIGTWQTAPVAGDVGHAQTLTLSGSNLTISGAGGNTVDLSGINTDNQTLTLSGGTLSISGGNSVALPTGTDSQNLSLSGLSLGISGGTGVTLPAPTPSLSGSTLTIANGGSVSLAGINTDNQNLGLSGISLSITDGTGITLPTPTPSVSGGNLVITTGGVAASVPLSSFPNIYNADGTLTSARTVTMGANSLNFAGSGFVGMNKAAPSGKLHIVGTGGNTLYLEGLTTVTNAVSLAMDSATGRVGTVAAAPAKVAFFQSSVDQVIGSLPAEMVVSFSAADSVTNNAVTFNDAGDYFVITTAGLYEVSGMATFNAKYQPASLGDAVSINLMIKYSTDGGVTYNELALARHLYVSNLAQTINVPAAVLNLPANTRIRMSISNPNGFSPDAASTINTPVGGAYSKSIKILAL